MDTVSEQAPSGNAGRSKSAAMLGLALSFGASGVLFADSEATAAVGSFAIATSANSSESPQLPSILHGHSEQPVMNGHAVYHTVQQGDSLWQIAQEHHVEVQDIKLANRISPDTTLQVGQVIKVPNEESVQPTLVSLLPGAQKNSGDQAQAPNLERLVAGISSVDRNSTQSELVNEVDEPAVVASEELTGDVSLRSAGIVSHSDGFQADLKQLASNSQVSSDQSTMIDSSETELQSSPGDAAKLLNFEEATDTVFNSYEVRPGDTVEDIALSLGTTSESLVATNSLEDPDFIVAGDTLDIPEEVANELIISEAASSITQSSPELTASSSLSDFDGTHLGRLQSTVENRINGSSTLQRLRGGQGGSVISQPHLVSEEIEDTIESVTVEDPYTADLLADVNSAQELVPELSTPLESDNEIALRQSLPAADDVVVNPQFPGNRLEARATSDISSTQNSELLAAAPLDPNVYVSPSSPATGQVVSPEMPILPSADEYLPETPDYFNGYIWPARGILTSGYGWRWGRMHRGIDIAGPVGTPIVSAADGVVERAGWNSGGYGNLVDVRHADGSLTRYAHNSRITVRQGQRVAQGQHIADMGSTGYSTGPHLHFEVHLPDRGTVNPMAMLPNR
ncbi:LysM peptidoglycan-binding domain-containing protein [Leptolyngbyaceae cyanobacterium CCMR0082]|uniref:LysM peptidoglycan-binding domain-containing protein n=2 Tax=Adonisia TaxID=2950183 RepID=A0A6M0S3V1_9CYAN|nr:LysM peptidoglycan-binding domain-containing protein [Adonisia turfae CCMR0082]